MHHSLDNNVAEIRSRDLGAIRVAEVCVPAGVRLSRHMHDSAQLVLVLEGHYRERWQRRAVDLQPGSMLFRPPGEPHANRFGAESVLALTLSFQAQRLGGLEELRRPRAASGLLADMGRRLEAELRASDSASNAALEGLALLLVARSARMAAERRPDWLMAALHHIHRHYAAGISLESVAEAVGRHRATVAAGFRRYLGSSVGQTIRDVRVSAALQALQRSRQPLSEIATACGFYDQAHMGRQIKQATGRTPRALRSGR